MGVHQYKIYLVPREYFGESPPKILSEDEIDRGEDSATGWWASHPPSSQLLSAVRSLLPTDKSWGETEEFVSAGDWSSDIRVWKDKDQVFSIVFRFSPMADNWRLMQRFLSIARDGHCLLIECESGAVLEPEENIIRERLAASRAMRFVRDPAGTIRDAGGAV